MNNCIIITETVEIAARLDPSKKDVIIADKRDSSVNQLLKEKTMLTAQHSSSIAETERDKVAANRINVKSCTCPASQSASSSQLQSASADIADTGTVIVNRETVVSTKRKLLEKYYNGAKFESSFTNEIEAEVFSYLMCKFIEEYDNALQFWKLNEHTSKLISQLAKTYLYASSSSVPVKQMFSSMGLILLLKRSSMAPHQTNIVSFIPDNYAKFFLFPEMMPMI